MSEIAVPGDIIFTYDTGIFKAAILQTSATSVDWYIYKDRLYRGTLGARPVGIVHAMVGAPAASMNLEELIAYGASRVYEVGLSGAIDKRLEPGNVVVLGGALSDEGTSKHYFKATSKFHASISLTGRLEDALHRRGVDFVSGDAWTTDAPYRETSEKVVRFRRKGAKVVNMESSAIFALAKYRGVEAASVQIVSDVVSEKQWNPAFHREVVEKRRGEVLSAMLDAIKSQISK
jgi:uridine phosphorylase